MRRSPSLNVEELRTNLANLANAISPEHRSTVAALGHLFVATFGTDGAAGATSPPPPTSGTDSAQPASSTPTPNAAPSMSPDAVAAAVLPPRLERLLVELHKQLQQTGVTPRARPRSDIPIVPIHTWTPDVDDV